MGGSSVLNYMLYVRGNRRDYDGWAEMGNTGWSFNDVLPYFRKSEDNRSPLMQRSKYHGVGGPLTVQDPPVRTPLAEAFVEAGQELNYKALDANGESQSGFMLAQGTLRRNARCSTAKAFLRPARNRNNLKISLRSHVLKIVIDPATKRARGVQFERDGVIYSVEADKEVILSAGTVASPQILMLSGVGPAEHLHKMDIAVIANLSVGDNLQDHVSNGGMIYLVNQPVSFITSRVFTIPTFLNYQMNRRTALSALGGVEGKLFIDLPVN